MLCLGLSEENRFFFTKQHDGRNEVVKLQFFQDCIVCQTLLSFPCLYSGAYSHLSCRRLGFISPAGSGSTRGSAKSFWTGEEQPQAPVFAVEPLTAKQLSRKVLRGPGGHQVEHEPALCACGKEG